MDDAAVRKALEAIRKDARSAEVASALPADKRPTRFMISIGLEPEPEMEGESAAAVPAVQVGESIVGPSDVVGPGDGDDEDEV